VRTIHFTEAFLSEDFMNLSKREADPRMRVRLIGLHHLQNSKNYTRVSELLEVRRHTVKDWHQRYEVEGLSGLHDKPGRGPKCRLTVEEQQSLVDEVLACQAARAGGRLNVHDIKALVEAHYQQSYSKAGIYCILKRIGMSWITSRSQHPKADEAKQMAFKKTS
jgi:transposase